MRNDFLHKACTIIFAPILLVCGLFLTGCASLTAPGVSDNIVLAWTNEALLAASTYDSVNYRKQLQDASVYFTPGGWSGYVSTLEHARSFKTVANPYQENMLASAVAEQPPVIINQGVEGNRYSWKVKAPLIVTYGNASTRTRQRVLMTVLVVRTAGDIGVRGLAIDQLLMTELDAVKTSIR